uniref:Uncharacterized protein n=1 Tax=Lepeophtheirus salmonis TaxID=72036 RepID=A0A0K2UVA7_LEPSM
MDSIPGFLWYSTNSQDDEKDTKLNNGFEFRCSFFPCYYF